MTTTLSLPEHALRLTESFQQRVGSAHTATAYENALLIASTLISDEKSGIKPVNEAANSLATFTLRDIMEQVAAEPLFTAAKDSATIAVKINAQQASELGIIHDYCGKIASTPAEAYLLTIMSVHRIYDQFKQEDRASLDFHTHSPEQGIQPRAIWLR